MKIRIKDYGENPYIDVSIWLEEISNGVPLEEISEAFAKVKLVAETIAEEVGSVKSMEDVRLVNSDICMGVYFHSLKRKDVIKCHNNVLLKIHSGKITFCHQREEFTYGEKS